MRSRLLCRRGWALYEPTIAKLIARHVGSNTMCGSNDRDALRNLERCLWHVETPSANLAPSVSTYFRTWRRGREGRSDGRRLRRGGSRVLRFREVADGAPLFRLSTSVALSVVLPSSRRFLVAAPKYIYAGSYLRDRSAGATRTDRSRAPSYNFSIDDSSRTCPV